VAVGKDLLANVNHENGDPDRSQDRCTTRLGVVAGYVELASDAHLDMGATAGSIIPTSDAVIRGRRAPLG
jgi:hypothetical protein